VKDGAHRHLMVPTIATRKNALCPLCRKHTMLMEWLEYPDHEETPDEAVMIRYSCSNGCDPDAIDRALVAWYEKTHNKPARPDWATE
jgi:hypothetical protein